MDLSIEIFDEFKKGTKSSETLGEHIFVQVKGTENLKKELKKFMKEKMKKCLVMTNLNQI
ncbi:MULTISPECIES: hypothetical protein [Psychrilyobacter]|uniref:Uncharacterized protein n=1 Tax=Psychrilyobacter piezotolerans TaxID=2293438 RepID=A0ABX9KF01_9FUSO|nr:hypothetical protein [Psychrilyobacter piezotolerans]RDE60144.1 hypothetical protein DV867_11415 [Psychrilyobacter sp. S5]REI40326.1 hypothetical protein DYH56_11415 [Psychrilyobacter piezotolerans]